MIQKATLGGRPALIAYITDDFEPASPQTATLAKVTYTDGQSPISAFMKYTPPSKDALLKFNPYHDVKGLFASGPGDALKAITKPGLEKDTTQQFKTKEALFSKATEAQQQFENWLNKGKGVIEQIGGTRANIDPEKVDHSFYTKPGPVLVVAPMKTENRSANKVAAEYGGHWDRLLDVVRGTIMVDKLSDVKNVLGNLKANGIELARLPKDRISESNGGGWRGDLLLNARLPNGMIAELQVGLKPMYEAKMIGGGHNLYDRTRTLEARFGKLPVAKWPPFAKGEYARLNAQMVRLYRNTWNKGVEEGMLKMAKIDDDVPPLPKGITYVEADNNFYRMLDGIPEAVLMDGQWQKPSSEGWVKAACDGMPVTQAEIDKLIAKGW